MSSTLLDVSRFQTHRSFRCMDGTILEVGDLFTRHYEAIMGLAEAKLIRATDSFGFVMAQPVFTNLYRLTSAWDNPYELAWFAGGWGDNQERYVANAVRKMRPLLRPHPSGVQYTSTLQLRHESPHHFENKVPSANDDGTYTWGDFAFGGAVIVQMASLYLVGSVSALSQTQDDKVARLILGSIAEEIAEHNDLFLDD